MINTIIALIIKQVIQGAFLLDESFLLISESSVICSCIFLS